MTDEKKRQGLFSSIGTRDDALRIIRDASIAFFVLAALQGGIGLFLSASMLVDAVLFAVLGYVLLRWQSRIAASLLLVLSLLAFIVTFLNRMGSMAEGGNNIILAIIMFWVAVRATEATFKLQGRFKEPEQGLEG